MKPPVRPSRSSRASRPRAVLPWPLRRALYLRRRTLAALATTVAVFAIVSALAPPRPEVVTVVALARSLPGGAEIAASDLIELAAPPDAVPVGALTRPEAAVGRSLTGPHAARAVLTEESIATGQGLARPGFVVVALPLADDALAPLVRAGVRLDLLDPGGSGEVIAADVRVVAVPEPEAASFGAATRRAALVEVVPDVASRLAVAAQSGGVAIALR